MALGFGVLRLSPVHFWSMTPRELSAAIAGVHGRRNGIAPLTRLDLGALTARYPDVPRSPT